VVTTKAELQTWVLEAIRELGGSARPIDVTRHIWETHETDLRQSGDLFFTWQYDLRWEAQKLRDQGVLQRKEGSRTGTWDLA